MDQQFKYIAYIHKLQLHKHMCDWFLAYVVTYALFLFIRLKDFSFFSSLTCVEHSKATLLYLKLKLTVSTYRNKIKPGV